MKTLYIDMDDTICDFTEAYQYKVSDENKYPHSQMDFFRDLTPIEGAIDAVNKLWGDYEIYFLTAPSVLNPLSYTEKRLWISDHFGIRGAEKLIICPNKGLMKGDFLIDDYVAGRGQEDFEGILINIGSKEFPTWKEILEYL